MPHLNRTRSFALAALLALAAPGPAAQVLPPADTTGMIAEDMIVSYDLRSKQPDSSGYLVYPDSTVGVYSVGGDTAYFHWGDLVYIAGLVNEGVDYEPDLDPLFYAQVLEGDLHLTVTQSIPVPVVVLAVLFLPALFLVTVVYLRRRLAQERTQRRELEAVGRRLAASREDERLRIARDLHDGPLQDLHALRMQLATAAEQLAADVGAGSVGVRRVRGALDESETVVGELRAIAEALRPPALGPFGLAAALRAHADRFRRQHPGVAVALDLDDDGQALPESLRLALFRIAQEAMTNAAKHGDPSQVSVSLSLDDGHVTLAVEDDGSGLTGRPDDPALAADGHFGLLGMRERADAAGAHLDVGASPTGGVRVQAAVPFPSTPDDHPVTPGR